jgi:hypothetical protein
MAGKHDRAPCLIFSEKTAKPNPMQAFDAIVFQSSQKSSLKIKLKKGTSPR